MRVRLHYLAGRREDRLVFDLQTALARELRLRPTRRRRRASEQLMQRYYRAAKAVRQLNVILLQNLHARLFPAQLAAACRSTPISRRVDELLDVRDDELFARAPRGDARSFLTMQKHPELKGMSARTLRALWRNRDLIDAAFRRDPANRARFMEILRAAARPDARAAADEPVRHPRPLPAGVRPHRRPDAARPVPRLHGRRAHPDGDPQPAPLHRSRSTRTNIRCARG